MEGEVPSDELPPDGDHRTFETAYGEKSPSTAIVDAIAAIEGVQPPDLDFALYDHIDPDALDTLVDDSTTEEETESGIVATFSVEEYTVEIASEGTITIEASEETITTEASGETE